VIYVTRTSRFFDDRQLLYRCSVSSSLPQRLVDRLQIIPGILTSPLPLLHRRRQSTPPLNVHPQLKSHEIELQHFADNGGNEVEMNIFHFSYYVHT